MKILVAGATGAVGRLLVPVLIEAGHTVFGTTRSADKQAGLAVLGAQPLVMDALDRDAVFAALDTARPDVVMHQMTDLAGRDFDRNTQLRLHGTENLVAAALAVGVQRMIAQSISWMMGAGSAPSSEDEPVEDDAPPARMETVRGALALEQRVARMPVGVILRYGFFYGPETWFSRDGWQTERVRRGELVASDAVYSFIHVEDAARAAAAALDWAAGVYNIVDDDPAPSRVWLPFYAELVGAPPPRVESGRFAWERGASNAKARAAGWQPRHPSWRTGFAAVLRG